MIGPEVGDPAPDFTLPDQHGHPVTLSSWRGWKNVVLIFYPWAFTPTCQGELCRVRDELPRFDNAEVAVLAVSVDSVFSHRVWAEREGFTFPLLADFWPHGAVAASYGIFDEGSGAALRGTFVIDRRGTVRYRVVHPIPDARDQAEYLRVLADL